MRWLLTRDVPTLAQALREAGEEVVGGAGDWVEAFIDPPTFLHPRQYPLDRIAEATGAQAVLLVDPLVNGLGDDGVDQFGYYRAQTHRLLVRKVALTMYARDDPATFGKFAQRLARACVCRPAECAAYLSSDEGVLDAFSRQGRAALWSGSARQLVAAGAPAQSGRSYSPKRDSRLFR